MERPCCHNGGLLLRAEIDVKQAVSHVRRLLAESKVVLVPQLTSVVVSCSGFSGKLGLDLGRVREEEFPIVARDNTCNIHELYYRNNSMVHVIHTTGGEGRAQQFRAFYGRVFF